MSLPVSVAQLNVRLSHKYVGTYSYLDRHYNIGEVNVLDRVEGNRTGHDCSWDTMIVVEVKLHGRFREANVERALRDTFDKQGCACSHDCCGCVSHYVKSVIKSPRFENTYNLIVGFQANY